MKEIFVSFFNSMNDVAIYDTVGWSESEYIARMFLTQFIAYDEDQVYPAIIRANNDTDLDKLVDDRGIYVNELTHIDPYETSSGNEVLITDNMYAQYVEDMDDVDGFVRGWFDDGIYEEESMYNILFAIADVGIIRNKNITDTIKKLVLLLFSEYKTNMDIDQFIDPVELMIQNGILKPLHR